MTFTDDDLKRLKEDTKSRRDDSYELAGRLDIDSMDALIARLEAAEKRGSMAWMCQMELMARMSTTSIMECDSILSLFKKADDEWRKVAGK